jgi:hypothetical protein
MLNHPLLENVAAGLRRQGLPRTEIVRLIEELKGHIEDLRTEQGGAMKDAAVLDKEIESRLGHAEEIVEATISNRRQTTIVGRHPILSFVVAPIPIALLSWMLFLFLFAGFFELLPRLLGERYAIEGRAVGDWPPLVVYLVRGSALAMRFVPPGAAALILCWCAIRGGVSWRWILTASGLIGLAAGACVTLLDLPVKAGQGQATLAFGFGLVIFHWTNVFQFLVPIAIGLAAVWRGDAGYHLPAR